MEVRNKVFERIKGGITIGLGIWLLAGILVSIESAYGIGRALLSAMRGNSLDMLYVLISGFAMSYVIVIPAISLFIPNLVLGIIMLASKKQKCSEVVAVIYAVFMGMVSGILLWLYWKDMADTIGIFGQARVVWNLFFHPLPDLLYLAWGIVSCMITHRNHKSIQN